MKTFYLKHDVESVLLDALEEFVDSGIAIDYIGVIHRAISDDEFIALDGFHANVLCDELPDNLVQFMITVPSNPNRIFFGV